MPPERSMPKALLGSRLQADALERVVDAAAVSSTTRLTSVAVDASITSVAPKLLRELELEGLLVDRDDARRRRRCAAPLIAARPMPPEPNTATVAPGSTLAVWTTAP